MFLAAILLLCPCPQLDENLKSKVDDSVIVASATPENSFIPSELPSAPDPKPLPDAIPAGEPIVPRGTPLPLPAGKGLFLYSHETPRQKKTWYALSIAGHSGATFDAWSTRRAVSRGYTESNPLLKPFAHSNAIYVATQLSPLLMDYLGHRMMSNRRNWVRRMWWAPQAAGASISFGAAIHNVGVAH